MIASGVVADGMVYADRDADTQGYAIGEEAHFSVTLNEVTGNVEVWGDHPDPDVDRVSINLRMSPTSARLLGQALIAASNNA